MNQRYFIKLSFKGTNYHGWQIQKNALSVQEKLDDAVSKVLGCPVHTQGCGRTDAGAHATEFYAQFDYHGITGEGKFLSALNSSLPADIRVHDILPVIPEGHVRFHALSRTYEYIIIQKPDPLRNHSALYIYAPLDLDLLNDAAVILMQYDDFGSFCKFHSQASHHKCKIESAGWHRNGQDIIFRITANRFLHGMVRAIIGTSLNLNKNKITLDGFRKIIESCDRRKAGESVPAKGLFLTRILYPENIFLKF
ncbi:MAG: tRNA pseudouridine(38-40) synthase TruA [Bacteroidetes bacterium]|nr:tRNA pseudouridine(38-40) synthase TruA [Bacteroidota bacterium]